MNNIFNVPANYHFFESLFFFLHETFLENLSQAKIFLPNQRSCRELRQLFLTKTPPNCAVILPKIKSLSDISFEDFFDFLPHQEVQETIDELLKIKVISGINHLFFLSEEVKKLTIFSKNLSASQNLAIALRLKNLFDEIENEEIDLKKLSEIDDSNLSKHRQVTLEFLQDFHIHLKNSLIKNDIFFSASYRNLVLKKFCEALEKCGTKSPLIIAGSTGSMASSRKLIKEISRQENGYVILHAADLEQNFNHDNHPQFFLNQLINFLEIDKKNITQITNDKFCLSSQSRIELLSSLMLPADQTQKWQSPTIPQIDKISLISAKDELEEARIIATILAEKLSQGKTSAVITNNHKLAKLLKYTIKDLSLSFNDSRDIGIFGSPLVNFILLVLDLLENDFSSSDLLAVLKNPLCSFADKDSILPEFENNILRQDRTRAGLSGITDKLESLNNQKLKIFFDDFYQKLSPVLKQKNHCNIANYSLSLISVIENLSSKKFDQLLDSEELAEFFNQIKNNQDFFLEPQNALTVFQILFSQISFFEKSNAMAPIQILSTVEARLLNHDVVIVASLNEGDFPSIEAQDWLGKKIKKDLRIDKTLKKIGQNAYDFCNYLCNSEVILSRSLSSNGNASSPSPFLLKLETLATKQKITLGNNAKYFAAIKSQDAIPTSQIKRPQPKPEVEFRPTKLAITDISKLISDPYSIYAKRILQLRDLPEIDFTPTHAEFGSFVHKALEEFIKNPQPIEQSLATSKKIFEQYFLAEESQLLWWPKFENIFTNFIAVEQEITAVKNLTEFEVKMVLEEICINGKIDRITFDENDQAHIFDYKTGGMPTKTEVLSGHEPQLTIAALMLLESGFKNEIASLNYRKVSFSAAEKITKISQDCHEIQILACAAKASLSKLFQYFSDKNNGYIAAPNPQNYRENEYSHLSRIKEWQ